MRILHFCREFSPLSQTFVYDYVTELKRQGIDSQVLALKRADPIDRPYEPVEIVGNPKPRGFHRVMAEVLDRVGTDTVKMRRERSLHERLKRAVSNIEPDVVHAHFGHAATRIAPVALELEIPMVMTFYGIDISQFPRQKAWRIAYEKLFTQVKSAVVLSGNMRSKLVAIGCPPEKIEIVHLARSLAGSSRSAARGGIRRFLSVGRLTEKKGHEVAIRAFARVCEGGRQITLEIVGEGPLHSHLEQLISELGMEDHIRLVGALPSAEVIDLMAEVDAFLLCSQTAKDGDEEGTPTVLIEAQACGLPCLSTTHAGIPEMFPQENQWLLAPEKEVSGVASRILELLEKSPEELELIVRHGECYMNEQFNLERESSKLIRVYAGACRRS